MSTLIIQFAKLPKAGKVKTRLQPFLGQSGCLSLHENLVKHVASTVLDTGFDCALFVSEPGDHPLVSELSATMKMHIQSGIDLGSRMKNAFRWGLRKYKNVILIGSDCPALTIEHFQLVNEALSQNDLVFIPAEDGGYVLVACKSDYAQIFEGIEWGSGKVWQQTQEKLVGLNWCALPTLWDVDREEDFIRLKQTIPSLCVL